METRPDPLLTRDYAAGCYQRCEDGKELPPHTCPQLISEDCLYLSATQTNKPKKKKKKKRKRKEKKKRKKKKRKKARKKLFGWENVQ